MVDVAGVAVVCGVVYGDCRMSKKYKLQKRQNECYAEIYPRMKLSSIESFLRYYIINRKDYDGYPAPIIVLAESEHAALIIATHAIESDYQPFGISDVKLIEDARELLVQTSPIGGRELALMRIDRGLREGDLDYSKLMEFLNKQNREADKE